MPPYLRLRPLIRKTGKGGKRLQRLVNPCNLNRSGSKKINVACGYNTRGFPAPGRPRGIDLGASVKLGQDEFVVAEDFGGG
jgi:hypothetical protein